MLFQISITLFYFILFVFAIKKWHFFQLNEVKNNTIVFAFTIKIIFGISLWAVYTYYYTSRELSDCFRYFDDSTVIYNSLFDNPKYYFQLLFGINTDTPELQKYIAHIHSWHREYNNESLFNDNRTIVRFNAIVQLFSFGVFHVHTIFMSFISLIGLTAIYKSLKKYAKNKEKILFLFIIFFPSVLFWGSGVLKEGLVLLGIGIFTYSFLQITIENTINLRYFILLFASSLLLLYCKVYILIALIPSVLFISIIKFTNVKKNILAAILALLLVLCFGTFLQYISPEKNPFKIIADKQVIFTNLARGGTYLIKRNESKSDTFYFHPHQKKYLIQASDPEIYTLSSSGYYTVWNKHRIFDTVKIIDTLTQYIRIAEFGKVGSDITIEEINPNAFSFLYHSPSAIIRAIFRPFFYDAKNSLMIIASIENLFLLLLVIAALATSNKSINTFEKKIIVYCILFCCSLAVIAGLTTPVLGALVRYKMPLIPFYTSFCIILLNDKKVEKVEKWISKFM